MTPPPSPSAPRRLLSRASGFGAGVWYRDAFLIWYPLVLAGVAFFGILWPHPLVLFAEVVTGSAIACTALVALCSARSKLSISRLLGAGLLQGYAVGALPDAFSSLSAQASGSLLDGAQTHTYALALCQIFLGVAVLWFVGEFTVPELRLPELTPAVLRSLKRVVWIGSAAIFVALASGALNYMGAQTGGAGEESGHLSFLVSALYWLIGPAVGVTATVFATARSREQKLLYGSVLLLQIIAVTPTGRRNFLYILLLAFLLYSIWNPVFARSGWKLTAAAVSAVLLVYVAWTAFLFLRLATYSLEEGTTISLSERVERAWALYNSGLTGDLSSTWEESGVETRLDLLAYDMMLLDDTAFHHVAGGGGAWNEFKWAIPSAVWTGKKILSEEGYASEFFNTFIPDQPNSIFTAGTIDFGFWGGILYPVLLSWLLAGFVKLSNRLYPKPVPYLCACAILLVCFQTEFELSSYIVAVRDTLLFGALFSFVLLAIPTVLIPHSRRNLKPGY
jgi:hypothetical protein